MRPGSRDEGRLGWEAVGKFERAEDSSWIGESAWRDGDRSRQWLVMKISLATPCLLTRTRV